MSKVIAIVNQKGGVGKTTSTYNLATLKAKEGKKVAMIDLDPQGSLTISCALKESGATIAQAMQGEDIRKCAYQVPNLKLDNFYIIPANISLASVEMQLIGKINREKVLKSAIVPLLEIFDYIFIDCPPQLSLLTINALSCANEVIIPVKVDFLSVQGVNALIETIGEIKKEINPELEIKGTIATFFEKCVSDQKVIHQFLVDNYSLIGTIRKASATYKKITDGIPVVISHPKHEVSKAYGAIAEQL